MIRKKPLHYKIIYDYGGTKRYEEIRLQTADRNEVIKSFLELYKLKQNGALILESDCRVILVVEINCYIRECIELFNYKEGIDLNEVLEEFEKKLTTSYETFKYSIKLGSGPEFMKKYEILFETEDRNDALKKFLDIFKQKQRHLFNEENIPDIILEISISPYNSDTRCLYLKYLKEESEIINKLGKSEKDLIYSFNS